MNRILAFLLMIVAISQLIPAAAGSPRFGPRLKKWYSWNDEMEVSKKWYDWHEMPQSEKRAEKRAMMRFIYPFKFDHRHRLRNVHQLE